METIDRIAYEEENPCCVECGEYLTFEEWELGEELCTECSERLAEEWFEDMRQQHNG